MDQIFNYIKVAFRSLLKFRSDAVLNVVGLSIGITISIVVLMYVRHELSYDKSYSKSQRTYRVITKGSIGDNHFESAMTPIPLASYLKEEFAEIETSTKIVRGLNKLVSHNEMKFNEDNFFYADSNFFSVFDVPFVFGDGKNSLSSAEDVVITTRIASKYFGRDNPIGKELKLDNGLVFYVSGVCQPQPDNSHFHFDFIASQQSIQKLYVAKDIKDKYSENWLKIDWYTYFVLQKNADASALEAKMQKQLIEKIQRQLDRELAHKDSSSLGVKSVSFHLQSLESIHLHSALDNELEPNSKYLYVVLFLSLTVSVLFITCVNFMNLTTAKVSIRIKEIGVRKLMGVSRRSLMVQFVVEAVVYSFVALFFGLVLVELLLPGFNSLFDVDLRFNRIEERFDLLYIVTITFMIGIISGIYPGVLFSRLREFLIFKEGFQPQKKGVFMRGVLIAAQMMVATFLIILSLAMVWQIQFLINKNLGFDSKNIIVVERGYSIGKKFEKFKMVLKAIPGIDEVSACAILPGQETSPTSFNYSGKNGDRMVLLPLNFVEKDFFKTLDIKLESGSVWEDSDEKMGRDIVINQSAKKMLEMNKPLGKSVVWANELSWDFSIKGVVKDFHFEPIQLPVRPLVLLDIPKGSYYDNLLVKVSNKGDVQAVIKAVRSTWNKFTDNDPFEYKMLDDTLKENLKEENLVLRIILVFMVLSLLVAWLGLRAFVAYISEMNADVMRSKKIFGAPSSKILMELFMLVSQFVLPGILLAVPLAFVFVLLWLNGFAYYSNLPLILMFAIAGVVWGVSFLLVLLHSAKSVKASPVVIQ